MDPNHRSEIDAIVGKVTELHSNCETDQVYSTEKLKPVTTRVPTDLSELEASHVTFSPEMQQQLREEKMTMTPESNHPRESRGPGKHHSAAEDFGMSNDRLSFNQSPGHKTKMQERMSTLVEDLPDNGTPESGMQTPDEVVLRQHGGDMNGGITVSDSITTTVESSIDGHVTGDDPEVKPREFGRPADTIPTGNLLGSHIQDHGAGQGDSHQRGNGRSTKHDEDILPGRLFTARAPPGEIQTAGNERNGNLTRGLAKETSVKGDDLRDSLYTVEQIDTRDPQAGCLAFLRTFSHCFCQ